MATSQDPGKSTTQPDHGCSGCEPPRLSLEDRMKHRQWVQDHSDLLTSWGTRYRECRLDTFERHGLEEEKGRQNAAIERCCETAKSPDELVFKGRGMVFYGPTGTGKDHLMAAMMITVSIATKCRCKVVSGSDLYALSRDAISTNKPATTLRNEYVYPDVLGISDPVPPGRELTPYQRDFLFGIVDKRYQQLKSTWVTMNVAGREELDQALGSQLADRLIDNAIVIACDWPSYRRPLDLRQPTKKP